MDLLQGRSGTVHENWLAEHGKAFRAGVRIATLDPFQGQQERHCLACSKTQPARSTPFISSNSLAMPLMRYAVASSKIRPAIADAQAIPLYQIQLLLRASRDRLTTRQKERLREAFVPDEAHICVRSRLPPRPARA